MTREEIKNGIINDVHKEGSWIILGFFMRFFTKVIATTLFTCYEFQNTSHTCFTSIGKYVTTNMVSLNVCNFTQYISEAPNNRFVTTSYSLD